VHIGLDFFDASINRVAAWVIGSRSVRKALLFALLENSQTLRDAENNFDYSRRLALMEEDKALPWPAVWDYYCHTQGMAHGREWFDTVVTYERDVLSKR